VAAAGCDVFMPDWGTWDMPCDDNGDCADGYLCSFDRCIDRIECDNDFACMAELRGDPRWMYSFCNQWGECELPVRDYPVGLECDPQKGTDACPKDNDLCLEFDKDLYLCTRECRPDDPCSEIFEWPFEMRCAYLRDLTGISVCSRPAWTPHVVGYRCEIGKQDQCVDKDLEFTCLDAGPPAGPICTQRCNPDQPACPLDLFCAYNLEDDDHVCAYPPWVGFGMSCSGDSPCPPGGPFEYCVNPSEFCTSQCVGDIDCPPPLRCSPGADDNGFHYCIGGTYE
jgi:hypothetical protein